MPGWLAATLVAWLAACAGASARAPGTPPPAASPAATPDIPPAPPPDPQARYGPEPALQLSPPEEAALAVARETLSRGGTAVRLSGALVRSARALARRSAGGAPGVADLPGLRAALAEGLSYDPAPTQFVYQGGLGGLRASLEALLRGASATHVGVGAAEAGGGVQLVVLASTRRARLDPFPRDVERGATAVLSGALSPGLRAARVVMTLPSGQVSEAATAADGPAFRAPLRFTEPGRHLVEVVAQGPDGPTVAALLAVRAGGGPLGAPELFAATAAGSSDPEDGVFAALNALRTRRGLRPLERSPDLDGVARRHSEAMRRAGRIAHVLPGWPALGERLAAAGIAYRQVRENVARGDTALTAHAAAAESPAHLENMVAPAVTLAGVGVVKDGAVSYLTEIFVQPAAADDGRLTLDARVKEALWRERARRGLPPLTADPVLDAVAREGAAALRDNDARSPPVLADQVPRQRALAGGDVFVASSPEEAVRSTYLRDPRFRRVGVGVVQAASPRFGPGRLFIAVVYSD